MADTQRDAQIIPFPTAPDRRDDEVAAPTVRHAIGEVLREERTEQERTLADVADDAAVSLQYLSEIERGRKEVSSDLLSSVCDALEIEVAEVLERAAQHLRIWSQGGPFMSLLAA
jgi:DNA-binding Xre family transcriptional regulator